MVFFPSDLYTAKLHSFPHNMLNLFVTILPPYFREPTILQQFSTITRQYCQHIMTILSVYVNYIVKIRSLNCHNVVAILWAFTTWCTIINIWWRNMRRLYLYRWQYTCMRTYTYTCIHDYIHTHKHICMYKIIHAYINYLLYKLPP